MSTDELSPTNSGNQFDERDRSNKEAIIVTLLFVGVVGMSMALVGLDINVETPPEGEQQTQEGISREVLDGGGLFDNEALAKAAAIPPGELVSEANEALIQEILYEDETQDPSPEEPVADAAATEEQPPDEVEVNADKDIKRPSARPPGDPYGDLVMVGDNETPLRNAQGEKVRLTTPTTSVTTTPRALLPDAPPEKESEERANHPAPRGDTENAMASPARSNPVPKAASSSENIKTQMTSAKSKLRAGDPVGAAKEYKKALAMGGGAGARLGLAKAQYEMGNTKQAQRELKKVLGTNPRSGGALLLMGSISQSQGDRAGARAYYQKFLNAHPSSKRADRIRGILTRL